MLTAADAASFSPPLPHHRNPRPEPKTNLTISSSIFRRRHHRNHHHHQNHLRKHLLLIPKPNPNPKPYSNPSTKPAPPSSPLERLLVAGDDALRDLSGSLLVDRSADLVVFSCRRSSLLFLGNALLATAAFAAAFRFLVWLGLGLWRRRRRRFGGDGVVVRRDRSLGGKEVVVAAPARNSNSAYSRFSEAAAKGEDGARGVRSSERKRERRRREEELPEWWPEAEVEKEPVVGKEEVSRWRQAANQLVRGDKLVSRIAFSYYHL